MSDDKPPEVGWLHYRLAVAFCSAAVMALILLVVPFVLELFFIRGPSREPIGLYPFVFSKWGGAILIGTGMLGFVVGGERMANFFAFMWGTHRFWCDMEDWLGEHEKIATFLFFVFLVLLILFLRQIFA